jgi:hypothetical protein
MIIIKSNFFFDKSTGKEDPQLNFFNKITISRPS